MSHKVTFEEMSAYINQEIWMIAAQSSGLGSSKKIEFSNRGMFKVTSHGDIIYDGASLGSAVDAYNGAP